MEFVATLCVPDDHPSLAGHFPGHPIVPGVVLLDLICAAVIQQHGANLSLLAVSTAKFLQPLAPGTVANATINLESAPDSQVTGAPPTMRAQFRLTVQNQAVAEGTLLFALAQPPTPIDR